MLNIEIVTPQSVIYKGEAESTTLPGSKSPFQVLVNHAPIVSSLDPGVIKIVEGSGNPVLFAASSGFVEVLNNKISILVDNAINGKEIDLAAVKSQIKDIESRLSLAKQEDKDKIKGELNFAMIKLKAAEGN